MGKLQAIDRQLELLSAVSASIRRLGGHPDTSLIDELLDERWECQWQLRDVPATVTAGHGPAAFRDAG
ncbi:hypothetical protein [Mycolicibacterium rhodesiae]|nr:hypothetical protein [Mycolicibacterium rhodesiae]